MVAGTGPPELETAMNVVRNVGSEATHAVGEQQGTDVLTRCGLIIPAHRHRQRDAVYPTCRRCARKC